MSKRKPGLRCPHCHKVINLAEQVADWDKCYGEDVEEYAMINIICDHCDQGGWMVDLSAYDEVEMVHSPALDADIAVPKEKKRAVN